MSRSSYFVCRDCKTRLFLGKPNFANNEDPTPTYFHIGTERTPPHYKDHFMSRAIWKYLADHTRHELRVIIEGDDGYEASWEYTKIGGDADDEISFEEYLKDWPGN